MNAKPVAIITAFSLLIIGLILFRMSLKEPYVVNEVHEIDASGNLKLIQAEKVTDNVENQIVFEKQEQIKEYLLTFNDIEDAIVSVSNKETETKYIVSMVIKFRRPNVDIPNDLISSFVKYITNDLVNINKEDIVISDENGTILYPIEIFRITTAPWERTPELFCFLAYSIE